MILAIRVISVAFNEKSLNSCRCRCPYQSPQWLPNSLWLWYQRVPRTRVPQFKVRPSVQCSGLVFCTHSRCTQFPQLLVDVLAKDVLVRKNWKFDEQMKNKLSFLRTIAQFCRIPFNDLFRPETGKLECWLSQRPTGFRKDSKWLQLYQFEYL